MKKNLMMVAAMVMSWCALADTEVVDGVEWTYTVSDDEASVGCGSLPAVPTTTTGDITIPSMLGGYPVTSICHNAFDGCSGLTNVTIPSSVTSIGSSAFHGCSGLTSVTIPEGVTSIGSSAFHGCSGLTSVTIPASVTSIGYAAFSNCIGLGDGIVIVDNCVLTINGSCPTSVVLPEGTRLIANGVFDGCSGLTNVTIPSSVTNIGSYAFGGCSGLTNVVFHGNAPASKSTAFSGVSSACTATVYSDTTGWDDDGDGMWEGLTLKYVDKPIVATAIGYEGVYDGMGHGITVNVTEPVERAVVTYSQTEDGEYTTTPILFTNVTDGAQNVYYKITADGYATTNSASVVITKGDIGGLSGEEPSEGTVSAGGLSKFDATYVNDGTGHTINTQALFAVTVPASTPSFSFAKDDGGQGLPTLPDAPNWVAEPPVYTNTGNYVVWYRITAPNYSNYIHSARVTITNKPVRVMSAVAQQRYPWNGLVDIDVTFDGEPEDLAQVECIFAATNDTTQTALPITTVSRAGTDTGSGRAWKRRYVWNAAADVDGGEIGEVVVNVGAKVIGSCVQLWKNGPYWAKCNVGATMPEAPGYYFWWGDTVGYKRNENNDGWVSVKDGTPFEFNDSNCSTMNKSNNVLKAEGYVDSANNLFNLLAAHDAATAHLGAPWRMATLAENQALLKNCDHTMTTIGGVYGILVRGRGEFALNTIFFPETGCGSDSDISSATNFNFYYWTSTSVWSRSVKNNVGAYIFFSTGSYMYRRYGMPIRPVRDPNNDETSVVVLPATVATLPFKLSLKNDGVRASSGTETLRYSSLWDGGSNETAKVTIKHGETVLAEDLTGEGDQAWNVTRPGLYTLTHTTYTNSVVAKTLTAQFNVSGLPIDSSEIVVTPYEGMYDGAAHGISVAGPEGTTVRYCATSNGVYGANVELSDVCSTQIWYEVSGGGYLPYTNSAMLIITPRPLTITSGTKTDFVYDGTAHADPDIAICGFGFVAGEGITTLNWATVSTVAEGEVENAFEYAPTKGTRLDNYDITIVTGKIAVARGVIEDEPGNGSVPEGGLSKFDAARIYNGQGQTIDTNKLVVAFAQAMSGTFSVEYVVDEGGLSPNGLPMLPEDAAWRTEPPVYTNAGEYVVWYRVLSPNYETFTHMAKVTITQKTLASALNSDLTFVTGGNANWTAIADETADGGVSVQLKAEDDCATWIETEVTGEMWVSFDWKTSCETYGDLELDRIEFAIDGSRQAWANGETGWTNRTFAVRGGGEHTLRWTYAKDESDYMGEDCAWVANVTTTPKTAVATPAIDLAATYDTESTTCTIATETEGATILYKFDFYGDDSQWYEYSGPFAVSGTTKVIAYATKRDYYDSETACAACERTLPWTLGECVNAANLDFVTGGDGDWVRETGTTHDGAAAVRSGAIGDGKQSWLKVQMLGPGTISFWWKADSEYYKKNLLDYATFKVDGKEIARTGGSADWTQVSHTVTGTGLHTYIWTYTKNAQTAMGGDCVWLDEISWSAYTANGITIPKDISGGDAFSVGTEWKDAELDEKFGQGKRDTFHKRYGNDLTAALLKKSGKRDVNGNVRYVWQDYVMGTDPTDKASEFTTSVEIVDGVPIVSWNPDLKGEREYKILGSTNLVNGGDWEWPTNALHRFFKVTVEMP